MADLSSAAAVAVAVVEEAAAVAAAEAVAVVEDKMYTPKAFNLQWHITERCNLRCKHCYQESYNQPEMPFEQIKNVLGQYHELLDTLGYVSGNKVPGRITSTGGEPMVHRHFYDILKEVRKNYGFSILTNGTLVDKKAAKRIRKYAPQYVQVSIDGCKETHDSIRGPGMYNKAVEGIEKFVEQGITTLISFTAHRRNYHEFPSVAQLGRELGVNRVWSDRLIPQGNAEQMQEYLLTPDETRDFFQIMKKERLKQNADYFPKTEIAMHRALQFLCGGHPYSCSAGKSLLTIDSNGDVYPCRRMPIKVGNILEERLIDIYSNNPILKTLREEQSSCSPCIYYKRCQGGLRCLSYAITGDPLKKDPGCWIEEHQEDKL